VLPIIPDIPTETPGLGFAEYVDALAAAIQGGDPPQFTVGLYGAWGTGKSSLLRALERKLDSKASPTVPVFFDAWRYERESHIIVPLLYEIGEETNKQGFKAASGIVKRTLSALVFSLNFRLAGLELDGAHVRDELNDQHMAHLDEAFAKPFHELRRLPDTLEGRRIVVLVDDLDRCSPESVVSLLQAINLVMDVKGIVFVLALDYDVLVHAVVAKYPHVSGHEFIEKMVQVPFRVPPLAMQEDFLPNLLPNWEVLATEWPPEVRQVVVTVAKLALRANPRQVKRLVNSMLLLRHIADARGMTIDLGLMAAIIGLQLRWPDDYVNLQESLLAGDDQPLEPLRSSSDEALARYAQETFKGAPTADALRELVQLTTFVSTESIDPAADHRLVREIREEARNELLAAMAAIGMVQVPQSNRAWHHPSVPDRRLVLQKTMVRLEQRGPNRVWQPIKRWDLRDEVQAVAAFKKLLEKAGRT
jgi:hypothetical protein